jgi:tyrosine-specific transport protein
VAYAAQGGGLLAGAVGAPAAAGALVFGAGVGGGVAFGPPKLVDKANDAFCAVVAASFVTLLVVGAGAFDAGRLMSVAPDAKAAFEAVPISILSLVYHNVIPTVSRRLGFDRARIARAVVLGSAFPLVMFIAWNALVQGVVDAGSSADPVAALIAAESGEAGAELSVAVQIFSFSAVVTSFVGFYYGMRGYVRDVLVESSASSMADDERILAAAVLVPPSVLAAVDPTLFLPALDAAGTFGITLLFGIVPAACAWQLRREDESSEVFVPGGDAVLAAMVGLSAFVIGEGALDALGLV